MAERRMFSKTIIDSDSFLDMPLSTQSLYFHLAMRADDDGFVNNPKKIMRMIGSNEDELKVLISKKFVLIFDAGILVIKHWKIHNYIRSDRYKETNYKELKETLEIDENGAYTQNTQVGIPCGSHAVDKMDTQVRLGKVSIGKYIYSKFYDEELKKSNNDSLYKEFIEILFGHNENDKPLKNVLAIPDQLTFKQFEERVKQCSQFKIRLSDVLLNLDNNPKRAKTYQNLNRTLTNWIKNDYKRSS